MTLAELHALLDNALADNPDQGSEPVFVGVSLGLGHIAYYLVNQVEFAEDGRTNLYYQDKAL